MNSTLKKYGNLLLVVIAIIAVLELFKKEVIDWTKSFEPDSKIPFGLYVLNQEAEQLFNHKLEKTDLNPYDYFSEDSTAAPMNLLLIEEYPTTEEWNKLLKRVESGDQLFVMAEYLDYYLKDTLKFRSYFNRYESSNHISLLDSKFTKDSITIDKLSSGMVIDKIDPKTTRILGETLDDSNNRIANFIEVKFGKGKIYCHTEPLVLTNYYLLKNDYYQYTQDIFSYLPNRKTVWFQSKIVTSSSSPLRFILSKPALRNAWYLLLGGFLLYLLFNAKRKQRVVPIETPLSNTSAEFVKTIGNLYLQEGNNKEMAHKKATYFLNKIRTDLMLDTRNLDASFAHKLKVKTGASEETIEQAIPLLVKALHDRAPVQEHELIKLNELLDKIYQ